MTLIDGKPGKELSSAIDHGKARQLGLGHKSCVTSECDLQASYAVSYATTKDKSNGMMIVTDSYLVSMYMRLVRYDRQPHPVHLPLT